MAVEEVAIATPAASGSAVHWAAILAGVAAAMATTLALVTLAAGLDLTALSPRPGRGLTLTSFTIGAVIALIVIQWLSAAIGGYLAGRLRKRWANTHTHEVFFRDTAHGFLTWCVATVLLAGAAALITAVGVGHKTVTDGGRPGAAASGPGNLAAYELDVLLRPSASVAPAGDARAQAERILARAAAGAPVPDADRNYLVRIVAHEAGVAEGEAAQRADSTLAQVRSAADSARKGAAMGAILTALSMFIGAFIACIAAALGGRLRELHP
jgi:hypothetical protein